MIPSRVPKGSSIKSSIVFPTASTAFPISSKIPVGSSRKSSMSFPIALTALSRSRTVFPIKPGGIGKPGIPKIKPTSTQSFQQGIPPPATVPPPLALVHGSVQLGQSLAAGSTLSSIFFTAPKGSSAEALAVSIRSPVLLITSLTSSSPNTS